MKDLQAILFDLDGVIIDSEQLHEEAIRQTAAHLGRVLTDAEVFGFKGIVEEKNAAQLIQLSGNTKYSVAEVMQYRNSIYHKLFPELKLIAGVLQFIQKLRDKGFKLGLTTSALVENQRRAFAMFRLDQYFSAIITSADIVNGKPHPEPYLKTAAALGVAPVNSLVIEDSVNGVRSGKAAGCKVVAITTSFPRASLAEVKADYIVDKYEELERLLGL